MNAARRYGPGGSGWRAGLLVLMATCLATPLEASAAPANGTFETNSRCAMFQSKARRTNPGDVMSASGQSYAVIEVLPNLRAAKWYRVRVPGIQIPRWIEARCGSRVPDGSAGANEPPVAPEQTRPICNTPERFDAHVLALTWQPAFCELKRNGPPECAGIDADSFTAGNLALHGLWPNRRQCGKDYGFCGAVRSKRAFCDYPRLQLTGATRAALERIMPSAAQPRGCLQRHEYWKHGTCRAGGAESYYEVSIALVGQINASRFVTQFLRGQVGRRVTVRDLRSAFNAAFGPDTANRLKLRCRNGMLVELQINLPARLNADSDIGALLARAAPADQPGNCRRQFRIDAP